MIFFTMTSALNASGISSKALRGRNVCLSVLRLQELIQGSFGLVRSSFVVRSGSFGYTFLYRSKEEMFCKANLIEQKGLS